MQERILPRHFISMEEDIVLVCRKSKISMQEGREVEGQSVMRIKMTLI